MRKVDLTNKRFGRHTAVKDVGRNKSGNTLWLCKCDCGKEHIVSMQKLVQGKSRSCGCYALSVRTKLLTKHGITTGGKPRTFIIWLGIKARCLKPKSINYKNYGGRGVKICDEWLSFEVFHNWAISNGYADNLTIDRIDVNGNYCPENCRWITRQENLLDQRRYMPLTIDGVTRSLSFYAKEINVTRRRLTKYYRLNGKEKTEEVIKDCLITGKGLIYFVNRFVKAEAVVDANN